MTTLVMMKMNQHQNEAHDLLERRHAVEDPSDDDADAPTTSSTVAWYNANRLAHGHEADSRHVVIQIDKSRLHRASSVRALRKDATITVY